MKPMVWHPEEKDHQVNEYLDHINHAPYQSIAAALLVLFSLFAILVLTGSF